jgi:hypothetical protein
LINQLEVSVGEQAVLDGLVIDDIAIEGRPQIEAARPVERHAAQLEGDEVGICHRYHSPLDQGGSPTGRIGHHAAPHQQTAPQVEPYPVRGHGHAVGAKPGTVVGTERDRQPVGHVD